MYRFTVNGSDYKAETLAGASEVYCRIRDRLGLGASKMRSASLFQNGKCIGHISYNGRIWAGAGSNTSELLYDNR